MAYLNGWENGMVWRATTPFAWRGAVVNVRLMCQEETVHIDGLYFPNVVFTRGQLYVAFSRITELNSIFVPVIGNDKQKIQDDCILTSNTAHKQLFFNYIHYSDHSL
ncbi:hypothetical protein AVEN_142873-1 [Araneus ventricosus]|uniref:Uncharacterized protein n=1 Tax=Araneus ventricosus TaxID=182803 RepID=A0A4Y2LAG2_ARAVE|nr:hypothetical protein AVEN_142873-1 [Araneus ventricosus]